MRAIRAAIAALMSMCVSACSASPSLQRDQIIGTYVASGCPKIEISKLGLTVGKQTIPFDLISIKRQNIISVPKGVYVTVGDTCSIVISNRPLYLPIKKTAFGIEMRVSNADKLEEIVYLRES